MTLFVGLGNPGRSYAATRHNIGWRVIDHMVADRDARNISKAAFDGELYRHGNLFFLKPTTYMNASGTSVLAVKQFFKIDIEDIVVIHDDIDLPFGALRFKRGGGHGGHNGLRSIDAVMGSDYYRVRIGIGRPTDTTQIADYVLHGFSTEEDAKIDAIIADVSRASFALTDTPFDTVRARCSRKGAPA